MTSPTSNVPGGNTPPVSNTSNLPAPTSTNSTTSFNPSQSSIAPASTSRQENKLPPSSPSEFRLPSSLNFIREAIAPAFTSHQENKLPSSSPSEFGLPSSFNFIRETITTTTATAFYDSFNQTTDDQCNRMFKKAYLTLSQEQKMAYLNIVGVMQKGTNKDTVVKLLNGKDNFTREELNILKDAVEIMLSAKSFELISVQYSRLTDRILNALNKGDNDVNFAEEIMILERNWDKVPDVVRSHVWDLQTVFAPKLELFTNKAKLGDVEALRKALELRAKAHAMMTLSQNHFLAIGDRATRAELILMLSELAQKKRTSSEKINVIEANISYQKMGAGAKKVLSDAVGHVIGWPRNGEQYMFGKLRIDSRLAIPDAQLIVVVLKNLIAFDNSNDVPEEFRGIVYKSTS